MIHFLTKYLPARIAKKAIYTTIMKYFDCYSNNTPSFKNTILKEGWVQANINNACAYIINSIILLMYNRSPHKVGNRGTISITWGILELFSFSSEFNETW